MFDTIIKNGTIVDGTKAAKFSGDIAIKDGVIVEVAETIEGDAKDVIDAKGHLVTPGFVDPHTHYDGQVCWDPYLTPSIWHGVTTAIAGNCGVGFAPVRKGEEDKLVELMEGVEDIPGITLAEGVTWNWESIPEYLDALSNIDRAVDIGFLASHGPVRAYAMGFEKAIGGEAAPEEVQEMCRIIDEAIEAGALGFSTSRTYRHRSTAGDEVPGTHAPRDELHAIVDTMAKSGHGTLQVISDSIDTDAEMDWVEKYSKETARPVLINPLGEEDFQKLFTDINRNWSEGRPMRFQMPPKGQGYLFTLRSSVQPLMIYRSYRAEAEKAAGDFDKLIAAMKTPEVREAILNDTPPPADKLGPWGMRTFLDFTRMFPMDHACDYEPEKERSIQAMADAQGKKPLELVYDMLLEDDGNKIIYHPDGGYDNYDLSGMKATLENVPFSFLGLSDAGAHCGMICDATMPSFMLAFWCRDRERGDKMHLETVVHRLTQDPAEMFGLNDRGVLKPGYLADINIIDFDNLQLEYPEMVYDLPEGGRRFIQRAKGYKMILKCGVPILVDDEVTGKTPGTVVRGPQQAKAVA